SPVARGCAFCFWPRKTRPRPARTKERPNTFPSCFETPSWTSIAIPGPASSPASRSLGSFTRQRSTPPGNTAAASSITSWKRNSRRPAMPSPDPSPENLTYTRIPLVLGLVGQRGLGDLDPEKLREQVRNCLGDLRKVYPDTPFLLLSSLAGEAE